MMVLLCTFRMLGELVIWFLAMARLMSGVWLWSR